MLSEKPWKLDAVMRLLLWVCLCIGLVFVSVELAQYVTGRKLDEDSPWTMLLGTLAFDGPILLLVCLFLFFEGITWAQAFGFNRAGTGRAVLLGLLVALVFLPFGLGMMAGSQWALQRLQIPVSDQLPVEILKKAGPGFSRVCLAFVAVGFAPVAEETLFRGILYPTIKQCGFPRAALWGTSFVFALIHVNLPAFIPLMVLAMILALLYEKTDNLLACIVAHAAFNAANVALLYHNELGGAGAT